MILVGEPYGVRQHANFAVAGTPVLIAPADKNRKCTLIQCQAASTPVYLGRSASVATSGADTGLMVAAGQSFCHASDGDEWYAVTDGGGVNVHVVTVS